MTTTPTTETRIFDAIINAGSGTLRKLGGPPAITKFLEAPGCEVRVHVAEDGREMLSLARQAAKSDGDVVIAAGGDGTISGVASAIVGHSKALGVIPLGTFNFFAKRVGVPLDLEQACRTVFSGDVTEVNIGEVNDRIFLNKSSVGLYPLAVRFRERMYDRYGRNKLVALLSGTFALLKRGHIMRLSMETENERRALQTRFVFVCNNPQELERFNLRGRECLNRDQFAVYAPKPWSPLRTLALAGRAVLGRLQDAKGYDAVCASNLELNSHRERLPVSIDGEVQMLETPLKFRIRPRALRVVVPQKN